MEQSDPVDGREPQAGKSDGVVFEKAANYAKRGSCGIRILLRNPSARARFTTLWPGYELECIHCPCWVVRALVDRARGHIRNRDSGRRATQSGTNLACKRTGSELPRASPISHRQDLKAGQRAPQASSWRESVGGALLGPVCCCWLCLLRVANGRQWRSAAWERRREGSCTLRVKHATSPNEPLAPRTLVWDTMYDAVRDYSDDAAAAVDAVVAVTAAGSGFGSAGRRPCWRNAPTVSWRDRSMGVNRTPRPSTARSWEKSACG